MKVLQKAVGTDTSSSFASSDLPIRTDAELTKGRKSYRFHKRMNRSRCQQKSKPESHQIAQLRNEHAAGECEEMTLLRGR